MSVIQRSVNNFEPWSFGVARKESHCAVMGCSGKIKCGELIYRSSKLAMQAHEECMETTLASQESRRLDGLANNERHGTLTLRQTRTGEEPPRIRTRAQTRIRSVMPRRKRSEDFTDQIEGQPQGIWARHKGKIMAGAVLLAGVAILGTAALRSSGEEWHRYCLQSLEKGADLWCCAKQVTADAASCLYERFESANFWTPAGDLDRLPLAELPTCADVPFVHDTWTVTAAQKLFHKIFG